jgi:electron transport complex protein RnfA
MSELLLIALGAALVNNIVVAELLGAAALLRGPADVQGMARLGLATAVVLVVGLPLTELVERTALEPFDLPHWRLIAFVAILAGTAHVAPRVLRRLAPKVAGASVGLALANSTVLGAALLNAAASRSLAAGIFYATGTAAGFTAALVLFAGLRERVDRADVPQPFRGLPVLFATAGLLSLAFMAFAGFARL